MTETLGLLDDSKSENPLAAAVASSPLEEPPATDDGLPNPELVNRIPQDENEPENITTPANERTEGDAKEVETFSSSMIEYRPPTSPPAYVARPNEGARSQEGHVTPQKSSKKVS